MKLFFSITLFLLLTVSLFPQYKNQQYQFTNISSVQKMENELINSDSLKEIDEKSPFLAFALSYMLPGLGQFYNGEVLKGLLFMGGITTGVGIIILGAGDFEHESTGNIGLIYTGLAVVAITEIWQLIDAPVSASRINRERRLKIGGYSFNVNTTFSSKKFNTSIKVFF